MTCVNNTSNIYKMDDQLHISQNLDESTTKKNETVH